MNDMISPLYLRLVEYFYQHPLDQRKHPIGVAKKALLDLLFAGDYEPTNLGNLYARTISQFTSAKCLACGKVHHLPVMLSSPFTFGCSKCPDNTKVLPDYTDDWHYYYNPALALFSDLPVATQFKVVRLFN